MAWPDREDLAWTTWTLDLGPWNYYYPTIFLEEDVDLATCLLDPLGAVTVLLGSRIVCRCVVRGRTTRSSTSIVVRTDAPTHRRTVGDPSVRIAIGASNQPTGDDE